MSQQHACLNMHSERNKSDHAVPTLEDLRKTASRISEHVVRTPVIAWPVPVIAGGPESDLFVKLELFQRTGSFKPRGAINTIMKQLAKAESLNEFPGVTAFSAGNHAIATAYAARALGTTAKVVMPRTANSFRMACCKALGAELVLGDTISDLLQLTEQIRSEENRLLVHPFEGIDTVMGAATVGLELCDDVNDLDAVIVPVGGGGLIAGVATAVKHLQPRCMVIGVEPEGARGMQQSIEQGLPMTSVSVNTIADSLGAPMHAPLSFNLVRGQVDQIVSVSDDDLRASMRKIFLDLKLAVEPACAASLAAFNGPLQSQLTGKRVALIACGSNIDQQSFEKITAL